MTVFLVETYVIKPDKQAEFLAYKKKWDKFFVFKDRPELFKEVKSHRLLAQLLGGNYGGYVELWEFESLADCERFFGRIMKSDYVTKLYPEFASLIVPGTYMMNTWNLMT